MPDLPELATRRLILTPIVAADAVRVAQIGALPDVVRMTISVPQPMSESLAGDWIARQREAMDAGTALTYTARLGSGQPALGVIALRHIDRTHGCAELSFWFGAESRGCGYASESASALTHFGLTQLPLHRIEAYHIVHNTQSERVLERIGFRFEGVLRERVIKASARQDVKLWAMLGTDIGPATHESSRLGANE